MCSPCSAEVTQGLPLVDCAKRRQTLAPPQAARDLRSADCETRSEIAAPYSPAEVMRGVPEAARDRHLEGCCRSRSPAAPEVPGAALVHPSDGCVRR
eukprot:scaffold24568_cov70-Phaeocystis_antarctica.AAC.4